MQTNQITDTFDGDLASYSFTSYITVTVVHGQFYSNVHDNRIRTSSSKAYGIFP